MRIHGRLQWTLVVLLFPLVLLGLVVLASALYGLVRYDAAYFDEICLEQYNTPESVVRMLEVGLQTEDQKLLAELQGLRWPATFKTSPSMVFVMLLERTDGYVTYLFVDMQTYQRHPHYVERVAGRWVVSPPDLYFYVHSGRWRDIFLPLAAIWWVSGTLILVIVWVARASERSHARFYGG